MAGKKIARKLGAKRMWIRRWLQAGRISAAQAKQFTKTLEQTGKLSKPTEAPKPAAAIQSRAVAVGPSGAVVTIQYDPSRFRVQFAAIRRGRKAKS